MPNGYSRDLRRFVKSIGPLVHLFKRLLSSRSVSMTPADRQSAMALIAILEAKFNELGFDIFDTDRRAIEDEIASRRKQEMEKAEAESRLRRGLPASRSDHNAFLSADNHDQREFLARMHPEKGDQYHEVDLDTDLAADLMLRNQQSYSFREANVMYMSASAAAISAALSPDDEKPEATPDSDRPKDGSGEKDSNARQTTPTSAIPE